MKLEDHMAHPMFSKCPLDMMASNGAVEEESNCRVPVMNDDSVCFLSVMEI
jgi:hypothetical protein